MGLMKADLKAKEPNLLIEAKQRMTREELMVWLYALAKVKTSLDFKGVGEFGLEEAKRERKVFYAYAVIDLNEFAEFLGLSSKRKADKVGYLKRILEGLINKIGFKIEVATYREILRSLELDYLIEELGVPERAVFWGVSTIERIEMLEDGAIKVVFSKYVSPLIIALRKWYSLHDLSEVLSLRRRNSIILYRLINERYRLNQHSFSISLERLKEIFGISKDARIEVISRDILKPSVKEINEKTSFRVDYKPIRKGRGGKIVAYTFTVDKKQTDWSKEVFPQEELNSLLSQVKIPNLKEKLSTLTRLKKAIAIWYLLHFPAELQDFAISQLESIDRDKNIRSPDAVVIRLIPEPKKEYQFLLDERVKLSIEKLFGNRKESEYSTVQWL